MAIVDATGLPPERVADHKDAILDHFRRLSERFPSDVTVQALIQDADTGQKRLWLVLDGDDCLATCMTTILTVNATGMKVASLTDLAGDGVSTFADDLCSTLEQWARVNEAEFAEVQGRPGWEREMKKRGYRPHITIWRKAMKG
jgi:hypothetical protein